MTQWLYKNQLEKIEEDYIAQTNKASARGDQKTVDLAANTRDIKTRALEIQKNASELKTQQSLFESAGVATPRWMELRRAENQSKAANMALVPGTTKAQIKSFEASQEKSLVTESTQHTLDLYEKMWGSTSQMATEHYGLRLRLINNAHQHLLKVTENEALAAEWLTKRKMSLDIEYLTKSQSILDGLRRGQKMMDMEHHEKTAESVSKRWVQASNEMENAWDKGFFAVMQGNFKSLEEIGVSALESIRNVMNNLLNDLVKAAIQPGISGFFNNVFNPGDVANNATYWDFGGTGSTGHHGGIMSSGNFRSLPKLHSGTPNLRSDEYPAILQRGEAIIPKNKIGLLGMNDKQNVEVIINNNTDQQANATENSQGPGGIRQIMVTIGNDVTSGGPVAKSIEKTYGVRRVGRMI